MSNLAFNKLQGRNMKIDSLFKIKDIQMNQLDEELNDLLELDDEIQQKIKDKAEEISKLRTQLEKYDSNYKTKMEKLKWVPVNNIEDKLIR